VEAGKARSSEGRELGQQHGPGDKEKRQTGRRE
jgi:hypothetical protein